jgi:hypothetical protein
MRRALKSLGALLVIFSSAHLPCQAAAEVIARWDFNSIDPDTDAATGSFTSRPGDFTLTQIGTANASFGSVAGGKTSDPLSDDNSQLRLAPSRPALSRTALLACNSPQALWVSETFR